jgi:quinol monooxygenase YgiN
MARFGLTVTFRLHPGQLEAFLPLMRANAAASLREEPGCLRFDVLLPEGGDGEEVFLYEVYTDAAAFEAHLASPHFLAFDQAVRRMVLGKAVRRYALEEAG